jgi:hypothetical protein
MSSQEASCNDLLPNLVVNECLFGCKGCPGIWTNSQTGHKIICRCDCGHETHKKNEHEDLVLQGASLLGRPERTAVNSSHRPDKSSKTVEVAENVKR